MGNRAVITSVNGWLEEGVGVYLHWFGGRDLVEAFLKYCELKGYRPPSQDSYGWARLCQVIGNFIGGENGVGIDMLRNLDCDNWDNGVYVIDGWEIVDRKYFDGEEQQGYDLYEVLGDINKAQPEKERLSIEMMKDAVVETYKKRASSEDECSANVYKVILPQSKE